MKRIYVGNLHQETTEEQLALCFAKFGAVSKAGLVRDVESGKPRGFGFVLMKDDAEGDAAIQGLHYTRLRGSMILVREALPPDAARPDSSSFRRRRDEHLRR